MMVMGDVWDRTTEYLGDHLGTILPIAIFAIFVPTSITGAIGGVGTGAAPAAQLAITLVSLAFAVLQIWGQLAISAQVIDPAIGHRAGGLAARRLPVALLVLLVLFLGVLATLVPLAGLMVLNGTDLTRLQAGQIDMTALSAGIRLTLVGYVILMLAVFLVFAARLAPLLPVVVAEREGVQSVGRAFALTRRLTWRLIGVLLLYSIVTLVAVTAARTVFGSLLALVAGGEGPVTIASVITAIVVAAVQTGFGVVATVFAAKLYLAIVRRPSPAAPEFA